MGLLSFFNRSSGATPAPSGADDNNALETARLRARRRLIGAVVLLGIGVIAFPILFETQPRPIPVDIAIEIPRKDGAAPLAIPSALPAQPAPTASRPMVTAPPVITEAKVESTPEGTVSAKVEAKSNPKPEAPTEPAPERKVEAKAPVKPAEAVASKPAAGLAPGESAGRFVVQVGAFADAASARGARNKVEQLGLRSYTQAVETEAGKRTRVRLGPFPTRDEADKAAAKVKAAGLPAAVLAL